MSDLQIVNNTDANRFEVQLGNDFALIDYEMRNGDLVLTHTEVPPAFEGRGIGGKLAAFALEYARANGLMVQIECPFVDKYVQRHQEYQPIIRGYSAT